MVVIRIPASIHKVLLPHPISTFLWAVGCGRTTRSQAPVTLFLLPQLLAVIRAPSSTYLLHTRSLRPRTLCFGSTKTQQTMYSHLTHHSTNRITTTTRITRTTKIPRTTRTSFRSQRAVSLIKRPVNNSRCAHRLMYLDSRIRSLSVICSSRRQVSNKKSSQRPTCSVSQGLSKFKRQTTFLVPQRASRNKRSLVPICLGNSARRPINRRSAFLVRTLSQSLTVNQTAMRQLSLATACIFLLTIPHRRLISPGKVLSHF